MKNNDKKQTQISEADKELLVKLNNLVEIMQSVEDLKEKSIGKISYQRMSSGFDALAYDYLHKLDFPQERKLYVDDLSIKNIAQMSKLTKIDKRDIKVSLGIDMEVKYLNKFLDFAKNVTNEEQGSDALVKLVINQSEANKKIEKIYEK